MSYSYGGKGYSRASSYGTSGSYMPRMSWGGPLIMIGGLLALVWVLSPRAAFSIGK